MGAVFAADQVAPVERPVAVKVIKAGMDSDLVLARFAQERQALALMDHPNIARIYDGEVTRLGRPNFVMEMVRGLPPLGRPDVGADPKAALDKHQN